MNGARCSAALCRLVPALALLLSSLAPGDASWAAISGWQWLNPRPEGNYVSSVSCAPRGACYAVGSDGLVLETADDGRTWSRLAGPDKADLIALACPARTVCYALSGHSIYVTSDALRTWVHHTLGSTWYLDRLSCPSVRICYVLGADLAYECHVPNCRLGGKENVLLWTGNGGRTWRRLHTGDIPQLTALDCPIAQVCYLAGGGPSGRGATVLRTGDGGRHWTRRAHGIPAGDQPESFACRDSAHCVIGGAGFLLTTRNAGASWSPVAMPPSVRPAVVAITCHPGRCLALGGTTTARYRPGSSPSFVLALSVDGRRASTRGQVAGSTITCGDVLHCFAANGAHSPSVSNDGGYHWRSWETGNREDLFRITCPAPTICRAVGRRRMLATEDGGKTWKTRGPVIGDDYGNGSDLLCLDARLCYATRSFGRILISHDGGHTWRSQHNPYSSTAVEYNSISCPARAVCFTTGIGCPQDPCNPGQVPWNVVLTTSDGGGHWRRVYVRQQDFLIFRAISCPSVSVCYVSGSPGSIIGTRDGGKTWRSLANPANRTTLDMQGIACPGTEECYVAGYGCMDAYGCSPNEMGGAILHTTDGGHSWKEAVPPVPKEDRAKLCDIQGCPRGLSLMAVTCASSQRCWVVGAEGTVLGTQDEGKTWEEEDSGTDLFLRDIACPSSSTCYAVGFGGAVLRLETAG